MHLAQGEKKLLGLNWVRAKWSLLAYVAIQLSVEK